MTNQKALPFQVLAIPDLLRAIGEAATGAHEVARADLGRAAALIREAETILNELVIPLPRRIRGPAGRG